MGYFPRPARPAALLADFRAFFRGGDGRYKLIFAAIAVGMTSLIITGFVIESRSGVLPGRQIIMVSDWHADRTDAEIVAQQKIDQKELRARKEARRREFQKADDALTRLGL